jgi:hypothetical protein
MTTETDTQQDGMPVQPCKCTHEDPPTLTEGQIIDLQGLESWLFRPEDLRAGLGRGVRNNWLKTLDEIIEKFGRVDEQGDD